MLQCALITNGVRPTFRPPEKQDIGIFDCEIKLETDFLYPCTKLCGKLFIAVTEAPIFYHGIRVKLDAIVDISIEIRTDKSCTTHVHTQNRKQHLLELEREPGVLPTGCMIHLDNDTCGKALPKGSYEFQFELSIPGEPLPAPFKSKYGSLSYKVIAHMKYHKDYIEVCETILKFRGYNNLSDQPRTLDPIRQEATLSKSLFSSTAAMKSVLTAERSGFLPGETLAFKLQILNPKGLTVRGATVSLMRKVTFNAKWAAKTSLFSLDSFESNVLTRETDITYSAKLTIPRKSCPSYEAKPIYSVIHFLKYEVNVASKYSGRLKGQAMVVIGTTRDPIEAIEGRRMSYLQVPLRGPRERSDSNVSQLSNLSIRTTVSLPPMYSQLSSRRGSRLSLDTLPPHYDDLMPCTTIGKTCDEDLMIISDKINKLLLRNIVQYSTNVSKCL